MRSRFSLIALAVAAALPSAAGAVDFTYSGFSTAAYAQSDTDDAQVGYSAQPESIDSDGSFEIDSKVGVQVTAKFNDVVSATVQGVGYANTWVRPPLEVYNLSPVYQIRGVDATWRTTLGAVQISVNPYFGDGEVKLPAEDLDVPEWKGLATTATYGSFQGRVGYSEVDLGTTMTALAPLINALRGVPAAFCGACASEGDKLDLDGVVVKTTSLGVQFDDGTNFIASEYARSRSGGNYIVNAKSGAYATYGRRFGNLMPYATYAISRRDEITRSDAIPAVGPLAALNGGVNASLAQGSTDQDSYSLGVRYEVPAFSVLKAALVKLQFDHIDAKDGKGILNNVQPNFDGELNMISASFDFIF
jgi:hypothetical protein